MLTNLFKGRRNAPPVVQTVTIRILDSLLTVVLCVNDRQTAKIQCVTEADHAILIGDIQHTNNASDFNKGYGTVMMENLITYAKENGYTYLYGNLSRVDLSHKERLHHFYQKFGFSITEYAEAKDFYYGKIELNL